MKGVIKIIPYVVGESNYGRVYFPKNKWKNHMIDTYGKKVKNILDNREYRTIGCAAKYYDISNDLIRKSIKENRPVRSYKTRKTYQFVEI